MKQEHITKYKALGLNVTLHRKIKGFSQEHLAELANISRTHMSRIENADCAVSLDTIFAICDALGVEPARLFDFHQ